MSEPEAHTLRDFWFARAPEAGAPGIEGDRTAASPPPWPDRDPAWWDGAQPLLPLLAEMRAAAREHGRVLLRALTDRPDPEPPPPEAPEAQPAEPEVAAARAAEGGARPERAPQARPLALPGLEGLIAAGAGRKGGRPPRSRQ